MTVQNLAKAGSQPVYTGGRPMADARRPEARTPWMGRRMLLVNFAFWTLFGFLTASNWLLSPTFQGFPYPARLVAKALSFAYVWALLTPVIFRVAARFSPEHGDRVRRGAVLLGFGVIVALVVATVEAAIFVWFLDVPTAEVTTLAGGVVGLAERYFYNEFVTYLVVLGAAFMYDISHRYRVRQEEATELKAAASRFQAERAELRAQAAHLQAQSAELHAQLAEARLTMLRTQLNPHFLFNTLNAVSALVAKDPRGVRDIVALLSDLLRDALKESPEQEIPLHEEMRLLGLYLGILEIRYQGQLQTAVTVDPEVGNALVPNLILQPLVENAVKHAIDRAGGFGTITVCAARMGDELVLTVEDTGPGTHSAPSRGRDAAGGVGLRLTRARLQELYGDEHHLVLCPRAECGMVAEITLPYHTREEVRYAREGSPP